MAELRLSDVRVSFGDVDAVRGVSFSLPSGKTLALLGPSGCGKTTLLNSIAGFVDCAGRIEVDGTDMVPVPARERGLSMVFQTHALFPHLTVWENVAFGLKVRRTGRSEVTDRVSRALALVELDQHGNRLPNQLSGGQRQRVALARALVVEPAVMLLDEPLSSLDAKLRGQMRVELRELQRRTGVTMAYVTHDKEEAFALGDYIGVMRDGLLEQLGTPEEVCRTPRTPFVASFLANCNLLPGTLLRRDGDSCVVELDVQAPDALGTGSPLVGCSNPHDLADGSAVAVGIPRTALTIADPALDGNGITLTVRLAQYMGDRIELIGNVGSEEITAELDLFRTPGLSSQLAAGDRIALSWATRDAMAVPTAAAAPKVPVGEGH